MAENGGSEEKVGGKYILWKKTTQNGQKQIHVQMDKGQQNEQRRQQTLDKSGGNVRDETIELDESESEIAIKSMKDVESVSLDDCSFNIPDLPCKAMVFDNGPSNEKVGLGSASPQLTDILSISKTMTPRSSKNALDLVPYIEDTSKYPGEPRSLTETDSQISQASETSQDKSVDESFKETTHNKLARNKKIVDYRNEKKVKEAERLVVSKRVVPIAFGVVERLVKIGMKPKLRLCKRATLELTTILSVYATIVMKQIDSQQHKHKIIQGRHVKRAVNNHKDLNLIMQHMFVPLCNYQ